jgi:hypothetical protein
MVRGNARMHVGNALPMHEEIWLMVVLRREGWSLRMDNE